MIRVISVIILSCILAVTSLEARGKKKKNKIVWVKAEVNTNATKAKRTKRSNDTTFAPVLRDVEYEYGLEVSISESAKARMPKDFIQFLEPEGAPVPVQRSVREIRKEVVGSRQRRALDTKAYYACSYEATNLICIRDGFEFPESDVKSVLPEAFSRYLYTREQLEEIQNFYFID